MTDRTENPDYDPYEFGLAEFESGNVVSLVEFELDSTLLLDEFNPESLGMLDEFNASLETIHEDDLGAPGEDGDDKPVEDIEDEESEQADGEDEEKRDKDTTDEDLLKSIDITSGPEPVIIPEPVNPVVGFVCEHALDVSKLTGPGGRMKDRRMVFLLPVPCIAMVKMSWLGYTLDKGASGVFMVSCSPDLCHHRTGAEINENRLIGKREPSPFKNFDSSRFRLLKGHPAARDGLLKEIDEFIFELGILDKAEKSKADGDVDKADKAATEDWLM